ncbi:MAG: ABC transporter ATP-binding protein [Chloroflexi bacterium]|jgi:ATP-binding cassette subfamily B protein|nr:ABC transporter ATP-binding protein [Chloroflexota bacterium]
MRPLLRLREYVRPYRGRILIALLTIVLLTAANLAIPTIIRLVIDVGLARGETGFLFWAALALLGLGALQALLSYLNRYQTEWIAAHIGYDLRNRLYDHIQHLPFSFHDRTQTGQLISRTIEDVRAIERFTGSGIVELIRLILLLVGIVTILFINEPRLALIGLLPMIPLVLLTTHFGQRIGGYFLVVDNALGDLSSRLQENVSGVQVVRAFAREPYEIERFDHFNRALYKARVKVLSTWSRIMPTTHFLVTLGTILILWFGGRMVLSGQMTIGEVVAFNGYLLLLANPAQQLTWLVNMAGEASAGVQRAFEVLDTQPAIQSPPGAIILPQLSGKVEFDHVDFQYSGGAVPALQDIDLQVEPNQVVALIGTTGSGKTSLVNLIPRFYDVTRGAVRVDGYDVRQVELTSLRRQIGIVLQTSLLFSVSIAENIAYGRPDASREEIIAAAKAAQAHDFIMEMPDGYETIVGERGVTLSGGQRQRVAIARALLMDPRILILDDSTSSVDAETERIIQKALSRLMEGRTTFVIAHRLSTVRRADLILVMNEGRIVERGRHEDLLRQGGLYREIYDLQLRDQEQLAEDLQQIEALKGSLPTGRLDRPDPDQLD